MDDVTVARTPEETPTVVVSANAAPVHAGQLAPGTILGGRYRVVSLIGSGGMGAVYRGDDLKIGQPIAMKFLRRTSQARERMLYDEVRIGRQVSHPNICRLYDIAEVDGQIFITMELVDGEDLASLLRRIGRLPRDKAASVARDLCAGLAAAHELGVIHRDLKPGNVMIDGRGRARITDFGLAVAESAREQAAAGTPAYMAPEQLGGGRATVQSDIYALGLVLYEVFTGRRVFAGGSVTEIIEQQRAASIVRPSAIVKDIDPAVERAIVRCLDPDPDARPRSVPDLMRELPSFDPLAAALAAGETPSPAMVAAANERGDLRAGVAWSILAIALASIIGVTLLSSRTMIANRIGVVKPPDVLLDRVRELIAAAHLPSDARDSAWYYLPEFLADTNLPVQFVYRHSPRPMLSSRTDRILAASDPAPTVSGMVTIRMDPAGHLVDLTVVPPQREAVAQRGEADFAPMFAQAGIDPSSLVPVPSEWAAPVDSDAKRAWLVRGTERRIETASYHGRPVWFSVLEKNAPTPRMTKRVAPAGQQLAYNTLFAMLIFLPVVTIAIAARNLRRGQGDRRGATRLALSVFVLFLVGRLLRAHHVPDVFDEWRMISKVFTEILFWAVSFWFAYVAIEPLMRRHWPSVLISWSRALEGRWRDPMIGRDLLIGIAVGATVALTAHATFLLGNEPMSTNTSAMGSVRHTLYFMMFDVTAEAIGRTLAAPVLLLVLRAITKRPRIIWAVAVFLGALSVASIPGGPAPVRIAWALGASCLIYVVLMRVGLLAIASSAFAVLLLMQMPLTPDPASWYFGTSLLVVVTIAAVAVFGFWNALAGKSPLAGFAVD